MPAQSPKPRWQCEHGVAGGTPWECTACVLAASSFDLVVPRLPTFPDIPGLYFERKVQLWGEAVGNKWARAAVEMWLAHRAGVTWDEWCADAQAAHEKGLAEDAYDLEQEQREAMA